MTPCRPDIRHGNVVGVCWNGVGYGRVVPNGQHRPPHMTRLLEVYAMPDCPGWRRATSLATLVQTAGVPGVQVRIIDLSHPGSVVPESVVASPTWLLDGRRIALGNPDPDWLLARLDAVIPDR